MIGQRFGRLVVVSAADRKDGYARWKCLCDCGATTEARTGDLKHGNTSSCGCLRRELTGNIRRTHGLSKTSLHNTWELMRSRCSNPNNKCWQDYGGRGIKVCERWENSFENFLADMGEKPFEGAQLDRIENDGDYSPDNCRWSTRKENGRNKRNTLFLTLNGLTLPLPVWAEKNNVSAKVLRSRKRRGWSDEDILTKPIDRTAGRFVKGDNRNRFKLKHLKGE